MNEETLNILYEIGTLSQLDIHFAKFLTELADRNDPELLLAAALVSSYRGQGHICLDLSTLERKTLPNWADMEEHVVFPELGEWRNKLENSSVVGSPGEYKPLILDEKSRLYLYRYWEYQEGLASLFNKRLREDREDIDVMVLKKGLDRLFPKYPANEIDWQRVAAFTALIKNLCVISGGPGTGKTTTVAKIIALILEQACTEKVRIALTAPTGKAASRLQGAIRAEKRRLDCADSIQEAVPWEASTIHRLLGSIPGSPYFRHNAQNTLPIDVVIVDEASMVDIALMSKLVRALSLQTRLILLGDKDQLASVEAGAVLGDICDSGNSHGFSTAFCRDLKSIAGVEIKTEHDEAEQGIRDCIIQLQKSYRFGKESGIGALSLEINRGEGDASIKLLKDNEYADIKWIDLPHPSALPKTIKETIINGFRGYLKTNDPWKAFELFERFRILCALREGPYGVSALNLMAEEVLNNAGLIESGKMWYAGRPLLIARNDYRLRLFNGDMGIVLHDPQTNNDLRAFFPAVDGTLRKLHPLRLPEHETVYAMTVHKSQGSEFDKALLILPDKDSPVLTRELIYTGITRARKHIEIWGIDDVFCAAVSRRTERSSGLRDALWG